jgi:hypothetical protein
MLDAQPRRRAVFVRRGAPGASLARARVALPVLRH